MLSLGSVSFFALGIMLVMLGANQAALARDLALDLTQSGFLGAVLALGLGVGVTLGGPLSDRLPRRPLFVWSAALTGIALLTIDQTASYPRVVLQVAAIGLGCGFYETIINAVIAERYRGSAMRAIAFVHASATAGAGLGPMLMRANPLGHEWPAAFHALGWLHLAFAAWAATLDFRGDSEDRHPITGVAVSRTRFAWQSGALLALAIIAFAYVGVENGLTLFAVPWSLSLGSDEAVGQNSISSFWIGLLVGRLALVARQPEDGAPLLAACGVGGAIVISAASQMAWSPLPWVAALAGVCLGPVYPMMMALSAQRFPQSVGTALGLVAGAGAAGGFCLPWLSGALADWLGVRPAITLLGGCALAISAAALALVRRAQEA